MSYYIACNILFQRKSMAQNDESNDCIAAKRQKLAGDHKTHRLQGQFLKNCFLKV